MHYWILDRYLLRQFVKVLLISFFALTGLFIVIDAFNNLDEFIAHGEKQGSLFAVLIEYYGARVLSFFDRTSGLLCLIAAMFVVTWLQKTNELTAIQAAGISQRRVIKPLLIAACVVSLIAAANREMGIPRVRDKLIRNAQDWMGDTAKKVTPQPDYLTNVQMTGLNAYAAEERISSPNFILHSPPPGFDRKISADNAFYRPPSEGRPGGYLMQGVTVPGDIADIPSGYLSDGSPFILTPKDHEWLQRDECFVASEVTFQQFSKGGLWKEYSSMQELHAGLQNRSLDYGADVRVMIHSRLVKPLLDMTLVLLGLPLVLTRNHRNVFVAAGYCLALVVCFFLVLLACQALGTAGLLSPAFSAWLPLLIFAPLAYTLTAQMRE